MDIKKTFRIIDVIMNLEKEVQIQAKLNNINSYIQNQQSLELIDNLIDEIKEWINKSEIHNFINSDLKILKSLWIDGFFDLEMINNLEEILKLPFYQQKDDLKTFVANRQDKLSKITSLLNSISGLLPSDDLECTESYQIVFSFSWEFQDYHKFLMTNKNIKLFLYEINQKNEGQKEIKISSVNNGCLEIFIEAWIELIKDIWIVLNYIALIYWTIQASIDWKEAIKNLKKKRKEKVEKEIYDNLEEEKNDIINKMINKLWIPSDSKSNVRNHFLKLMKSYEEWLSIEVKTPLLSEPEEINEEDTEEEKKEKEKLKKIYEEKKVMDDNNRKIMKIQKEWIQLSLPEPEEEK